MKHLLRRAGLALVLAVLTASVVAAGGNWPRVRGADGGVAADDPRLPDTWGPSTNIVWKRDVPGWSWSSPLVWGDHVFVVSVIDTADADPSQPASAYATRAAGGPMTFKDLSSSKGEHRWMLYAASGVYRISNRQ